MTLQEWWDSGFDPTPIRVAATRPHRDPALSVLQWSGKILLVMCLAPFWLMAVFLRTFVRI